MMEGWFISIHCLSHEHCHNCRDKENGRGFRESLQKKFHDIEDVDFDCPYDMVWGEVRQVPVRLPTHPHVQISQRLRDMDLPRLIAEVAETDDGARMLETVWKSVKDIGCDETCQGRKAAAQLRVYLQALEGNGTLVS